nr:MAG TPA: hypothetical protein [Bacteriophage sp.]
MTKCQSIMGKGNKKQLSLLIRSHLFITLSSPTLRKCENKQPP